ncbi:hypothetical protein KFK09_029103 [Dendrobium nobile]|uniref:Protein NO VEIN C-terminal domain-containing protein n=1 Tax=Dendrobium nobile TaxID=94219 RepID=A0A8T3A4T6_DENNO|nr:hypothetical protein KFK09_029103 [Dendrobium nobile]
MHRPPPQSWPYGMPAGGSGGGGYIYTAQFLQSVNVQFPANVQYTQQPPNFPQTVYQNPRVVQPQNASFGNRGFPAARPFSMPPVSLEAVESEAARVHKDLVAAGENVSVWRVSQSVLVKLKVDSWSSLGFHIQDVPTLQRLLLIEGKVNALVHCFVCARMIISMHELEVSLCQNMGVRQFEELGLGPFLLHPLIKHYFAVPKDSTEVFKITSEEIVLSLKEFISKSKKMISAEKFLSFLADQKSVPVKEMLGVRIRSLGFYVHHIREASKAEYTLLKEKLNRSTECGNIEVTGKMCGFKPRGIAVEKQILDKRFNHISKYVKRFSSKLNDSGNKHVYFVSSDDDDDSKVDYVCDVEDDGDSETDISSYQSISPAKGSGQHVNSCPYPSNSEEMVRLGLKPADSSKPSSSIGCITNKENMKSFRRKRKLENNNGSKSSCKFLKSVEAVDLKAEGQMCDLTLSNVDIEKFVATWKVACQKHSLAQVLDMMLSFYVEKSGKRKKVKKFVSSYPVIGWFNVAVTSIKRGMFESIYDTFQALNEKELRGTDSVCLGEMIDVRPSVEVSDTTISIDCVCSVTHDDIIKKIAYYFENYQEGCLSPEKKLAAIKRLFDCEMWLMAQFNVSQFCSLGHGNFYDFLEKYISILPHEMRTFFSKDHFHESSVEICLNQQQLGVMLSQAEGNLIGKADASNFDAVSLLKKQFPIVSFYMVGADPQKSFEKLINEHKESSNSSCVLFSACLLGDLWNRNLLVCKENASLDIGGMETEMAQKHTFRRTSKDAVECLLNVPMLADLFYWSHWDLLYAPSLGPLPEFLLNKINSKKLLCIATVDGKFVRVDQTATVDEFLEAFVQRSSFRMALKFLSLLCLYRGTINAPLALLKCYAQKAVDVIIQNSADSVEVNVGGQNCIPGKIVLNSCLSCCCAPIDSNKDYNERYEQSRLCTGLCRVNDAIANISRTILECLRYLPSEFRSFAAEIFLSGLQSITKRAPVVILNQCIKTEERIMLHDIGISLGVTEWATDHHQFSSSSILDLSEPFKSVEQISSSFSFESALDNRNSVQASEISSVENQRVTLGKIGDALVVDANREFSSGVNCGSSLVFKEFGDGSQTLSEATAASIEISEDQVHDATAIVEWIRQEEFGLVSNSNKSEDVLLKKQHARLGRALHCLSQELYSQDSHFILELVQNADDNIYTGNVEPELVFILHETGIVVLNNELGFSAENIRALCDVGNSTKKGSGGGYIGKKGIGFKSVFRVTDAPEIHSNGFHVKFDITEGQIGFVLPTVIPPFDADTLKQYLCGEGYQGSDIAWNTCIFLPFRSQSKGGASVSSIISMFSDLHPSLLLFLHRLRCIKFRNLLSDRFIVMRKSTLPDGIVKISHGEEVMSWLVISKKLRSSVIRTDVEATDISLAFTLQESEYGEYKPILRNQPVFSFLPLRNYGLKFILHGDFVLPSSREEVDGDSAWNQWLLSEFPSLFFSAEQSFCALPCFLENPGKAVTIYMSFVPLVGEVHGFFSQLPQMIISLLRISKCLLQDSPDLTWVLPCRVLRGWNEQARLLLSNQLLQRYLGLVYLHKDVKLSDTLAMSLGIQDYGPKILVEVMESVCNSPEGLESLGIDWLSAWIADVYVSLSMNFPQRSLNAELEYDIINDLKNIPLIPLSDGSYGYAADGPIWLPCDVSNIGSKGEYHPADFPSLFKKLKIVTPQLFSVATKNPYSVREIEVNNVVQMLLKIGVQQLSAHEVIKNHILIALSNKHVSEDRDLMIEYLSFIMLHLQNDCVSCQSDRLEIITELQKVPLLLTNHGYKCPSKEPIHFGREYGNPVDAVALFDAVDIKWIEVDPLYLKHPSTVLLSSGLMKWRAFFLDLGVTDFVQVTFTEKNVEDILSDGTMSITSFNSATTYVKDWESPELVYLLSIFSSKKLRSKCIYLLEVLDKMWDDNYSVQAKSFIISKIDGAKKPVVSSFMKSIREFAWIASTMDKDLHRPNNVFYDCEQVHSILGTIGPYAVPKINSKVLANDIGFKMEVSIDEAVEILQFWRMSMSPFVASIAQMLKFYTLISSGIATSSSKIINELISSRFIFVPFMSCCESNASASGMFLSPKEVYWQDPTGCVDRLKKVMLLCPSTHKGNHMLCKSLGTVYPTLHDFFVNVCEVSDTPSFSSYFQILQQLSSIALPSQVAHKVFQVLVRWSDGIKSGLATPDEISELKDNFMKLENAVLPTDLDKWVSLHPSFGLICWSDNDELKKQFKHSNGVDFIQFGELSVEENALLFGGVANILHIIGVPAISEIVSREAIFYGAEDNRDKVSLVNWVIPYGQRYIHKLHLDTYLKLKQLGFDKLSQLQIVVVNKLFYKHTLQGRDCASKRQFECNCLLQGNILYACQTTDAHSMFLELSRYFFNGSSELHFANFLHMVTTMAISGSTAEQIEFFVVNSQKIPKLPDDESLWSISSVCEVEKRETSPSVPVTPMDLECINSKSSHRKPGISSCWPPTDWKTAPDFEYPRSRNLRLQPYNSSQAAFSKVAVDVGQLEAPISVEIDGNWTLEEGSIPVSTSVLQDSELLLCQSHEYPASEPTVQFEEEGDISNQRIQFTNPLEKERIKRQTPEEQLIRRTTGRLGEMLAFKYYTEKLGCTDVKWVNKETESGLPYDLVVGENESRQYIEVKATRSATKDWFEITTSEWKFAFEKGDSYSIAHVVILGTDKASVTVLKNPYKLCRQNVLGLALLMSKR